MSLRFRLVIVLVLLALAFSGGGGILSPQVDRVTYVYEKDQTSPPRGVVGALESLNKAGQIIAAHIDVDIIDGTGETPDQYKPAIEAAKKEGLPSLVVQAGDEVVRVVKDPKTAEEVTGAL